VFQGNTWLVQDNTAGVLGNGTNVIELVGVTTDLSTAWAV
jgi:hypothetical protein